jgi:hypothetical protein
MERTMVGRLGSLVLAAVAGAALASGMPADRPLVGPSLAAARIFSADSEFARRWLSAADAETPAPVPDPGGAELTGVDEADLVAMCSVASTLRPERCAEELPIFAHGHHGHLTKVSPRIVEAVANAAPTDDLVARVSELASQLRGQPKNASEVALSLRDVRKVVKVCRATGRRAVFVYFSE